MKKILIIGLLFFSYIANSQIVEGEDGLYYDENNEIFTGEYIENFEKGKLKLKMYILNGKLDGNVEYFFKDGSKKEIRAYDNGLMHGTWITWSEKGIKIAEANYKNNVKDGKWYVWDENDVKRYEMEYEEGKKVGVWFIWDENGKLVNEKDFNSKN